MRTGTRIEYSSKPGTSNFILFPDLYVDDPDLVTAVTNTINRARSAGRRSIDISIRIMQNPLAVYHQTQRNPLAKEKDLMLQFRREYNDMLNESERRFRTRRATKETPITRAARQAEETIAIRTGYAGYIRPRGIPKEKVILTTEKKIAIAEEIPEIIQDVIISKEVIPTTETSITELTENIKAIVPADATAVTQTDLEKILNLTSNKTQRMIGGQMFDVYTDDVSEQLAGFVPPKIPSKIFGINTWLILTIAFVLFTYTGKIVNE